MNSERKDPNKVEDTRRGGDFDQQAKGSSQGPSNPQRPGTNFANQAYSVPTEQKLFLGGSEDEVRRSRAEPRLNLHL
jgi:hypothetical protein